MRAAGELPRRRGRGRRKKLTEVLLYELTYGGPDDESRTDERIIRAALEQGQPIPESLANAPEISPENLFYWRAWQDLSSCRYELQKIPWSAIAQWAVLRGVEDPDEIDLLRDVLWGIDEKYLKFMDQKRETDRTAMTATMGAAKP